MKKTTLVTLIREILEETRTVREEQGALMTGEELAQLVGNNPLEIEDGIKIFDYDNAEQFLRFFHKHSPEKVYRPKRSDAYSGNIEGRFVAVDKPRIEKPSTYTPPKPLSKAQQDASVQRFYDDLKYKGD
jgi:hypothetical protein